LGLASLETEDGGVANGWALAEKGLVPFNPVVDNAVLTRLVIEETVYVIHDDHVYIQKQCRALQVGKTILRDGKFGENSRPVLFVLVPRISRERNGLNPFLKAGRVIGNADKTERAMKVLPDGTIESIYKDDLLLGTEITINHGDGLKTVYRFVSETEGMKVGDKVEKGDVMQTLLEARGEEKRKGGKERKTGRLIHEIPYRKKYRSGNADHSALWTADLLGAFSASVFRSGSKTHLRFTGL
jgi:hypothetical protein